MGVFSAKNSPNMDVKRNTFPLSFSNNLTMQFGKIYPVFVKPCDPGDSFNIKASFGLNFLPTVYPVQTPMKAYLHFFYCRNRTVWTDFMNFYTMKDRAGTNVVSSTYVPPYLDFSKQKLGASSLADYMGIPVLDSTGNVPLTEFRVSDVLAKGGGQSSFQYTNGTDLLVSALGNFVSCTSFDVSPVPDNQSLGSNHKGFDFLYDVAGSQFDGLTFNQIVSAVSLNPSATSLLDFSVDLCQGTSDYPLSDRGITQSAISSLNTAIGSAQPTLYRMLFFDESQSYIGSLIFTPATTTTALSLQYSDSANGIVTMSCRCSCTLSTNGTSDSVIKFYSLPVPLGVSVADFYKLADALHSTSTYGSSISSVDSRFLRHKSVSPYPYQPLSLLHSLSFDFPFDGSVEVELKNPYFDSVDNPNGLKISSLPFRHYEAIYNYFYRDNRNNPLRNSDGLPVYNEVLLPSQLTGGVETSAYDFHYRNWEQDFLTTCVQEPQLGQAPLVGISSTGVASFSNEDGSVSNVQLKVAEDGDTVVGFETSEGMTAPIAHSLVELATQGISISDFRNVNAFQTWLEVQMRKTLRFGDSIQGHFNVNPKYDDYLYPEFIGGVTQEIDTYQVNQTSPSDDAPLGAYAGQAICKGSVPRAISKFCDEPGYIIGLLSIVPQPVYSQILPKHYLRRETLDYHFPEFNNISYQPVTYAEVCPVLAFNENKSLNSVFGYQRPWYDLISSLDEAHGQFLTTLNGFILSRRFVSYPTLGDRFLTVHPEDLNDIFSTAMTDSNDVILGQIYFDVVKKTSVSKFGIPSLQIG